MLSIYTHIAASLCIWLGTHLCDLFFLDIAERTWTFCQEANACKEDADYADKRLPRFPVIKTLTAQDNQQSM